MQQGSNEFVFYVYVFALNPCTHKNFSYMHKWIYYLGTEANMIGGGRRAR